MFYPGIWTNACHQQMWTTTAVQLLQWTHCFRFRVYVLALRVARPLPLHSCNMMQDVGPGKGGAVAFELSRAFFVG